MNKANEKKKRITCKEIIKEKLVQAIMSPEQLRLLNPEELIKFDFCVTDDEKINFISQLRSDISHKRRCKKITNDVYLLLMAYNHSAGLLTRYMNKFHERSNQILRCAHCKALGFTMLEFDCCRLRDAIYGAKRELERAVNAQEG